MDGAEKSINIVNSTPDSKLYEYKLGIERITEDLVKFGLTKSQAKVFIYLGKYGSKTSPEVCKDLKLPRTETYHILNVLTNRGIVVAEFSHPARYSAIQMEMAIKIMVETEHAKIGLLAEKEKEITELWNKIPSFFTPSCKPDCEKFQMLQGSPRIHSKMKNMILNAKVGSKLLCGAKDLSRFYYSNLLESFDSSTFAGKFAFRKKINNSASSLMRKHWFLAQGAGNDLIFNLLIFAINSCITASEEMINFESKVEESKDSNKFE